MTAEKPRQGEGRHRRASSQPGKTNMRRGRWLDLVRRWRLRGCVKAAQADVNSHLVFPQKVISKRGNSPAVTQVHW